MKKSIIFISLLFSLFMLQAQTDGPVAVVKLNRTEALTQSQFRWYEELTKLQKNGAELTLDEKKQLRDSLVDQMLLRQDADALGITVSDNDVLNAAMQNFSIALQQQGIQPVTDPLRYKTEYTKMIVAQGQSQAMAEKIYQFNLENIKNSLILQSYVRQTKRAELSDMGTPSEEILSKVYNQNIAQFVQPEYVLMNHIFYQADSITGITVKTEAEDLYRKITSGSVDFDEVVKTSGNLFPYSQVKGQPIMVARTDTQIVQVLGDTFVDALFVDDNNGKIIFLQSNMGFHIVRIDEYSPAKLLGMNDLILGQQVSIMEYLSQNVQGQMEQNLLESLAVKVFPELRERAEITTDPFEGSL